MSNIGRRKTSSLADMKDRLAFLDQLMPYAPNEAAYGSFHADIHDWIEICEWFLAEMEARKSEHLTEDEMVTFLIDMEIQIEHAMWHFKSLRKQIRRILANLPD